MSGVWEVNEEQERAIKRLDRALKNFDVCGLVGHLSESGTIHVFLGRTIPMDAPGGVVNTEKEVEYINSKLEAGAY